jgi:uncharacterized protein YndB with AHSA1/START domain
MTSVADTSVKKSIVVNTSVERAFEVFTSGFDSWWPRSHHIGKSPMKQAFIEGRVGGRCYTTQEDGTDCPWGQILAWDPPHRFVMAWQITHEWGFQADLSKSSEVEVRFTPEPGGGTRVDLDHRYFERMGPDGETMRTGVGGPGGWSGLLDMFKARVETTNG